MCFEEKKMPFVGSDNKKILEESMTLPLGKFGENVRVGLFCDKPCLSLV